MVPGFPCSSVSKESACNAGDPGLIPGWGRSPGEGNGNPLQYSCLENPKDRGAWQATVHGILQARILEWVALPFSRGSSQPKDWTQVSCIAGWFFTDWATREGLKHFNTKENLFHKKSGWFSSTGDKLSGSGVSPGTQALSMFSCPSFCFCPLGWLWLPGRRRA